MTVPVPQSPETLGDAARVFARHWSPRILAAATTVCVAARVAVGTWSPWDLAVVAAILAAWPLIEWLIHVYILHYRPVVLFGRTIDFPVPRSHRAHHLDPGDPRLVFIPTHVFAYAIPLQFALWFGLAPSLPLALTGVAFYFGMALQYEWAHFLIHTRYRPRSRYFQRRWRNHRLHHFKNEHYWFGVSTVSGDRLLGTAPPFATIATSPTCRTLGQTATLGT
jgi:hypothetical protein